MENQYRVKEILTTCAELQRLASRWNEDYAVAELMRRAVACERGFENNVIALCRLLFRARDGGALRRPRVGEPCFIGQLWNTVGEPADWPMEPIHLFCGVPFFVVKMYSLAGIPESPACYLAYCLRVGTWNSVPYPDLNEADVKAAAEEFVATGPWARPLNDSEKQFVLAQVG